MHILTTVVQGLEEVWTHFNGRAHARLSEVHFLTSHLQHGDVVVSFSVGRVDGHGCLEGLVGHAEVSQGYADMPHIVPAPQEARREVGSA